MSCFANILAFDQLGANLSTENTAAAGTIFCYGLVVNANAFAECFVLSDIIINLRFVGNTRIDLQ